MTERNDFSDLNIRAKRALEGIKNFVPMNVVSILLNYSTPALLYKFGTLPND